MHLIKEKYDIDEMLNNKINHILKFLNIKDKLVEGNIINIKNTNLAYIEPHKLKQIILILISLYNHIL